MAETVKATLVEDIDAALDVPGAYEWNGTYGKPGETSGMTFICPCGCGRPGWLPVNRHGHPGPSWDWNGNREAPTLRPSVLQVGGCEWHGWLTDGVWKSC